MTLNGETLWQAIVKAVKAWWRGPRGGSGYYKMALVLALCLSGCMNVKRGDFEVNARFTDFSTKDFTYLKTVNGTTNEYFHVKAPASTSSESVHWVCNAACSIAGACLGAPAGPAGVVGGAAAGGGVSELVQKWIDKGKKLVGK